MTPPEGSAAPTEGVEEEKTDGSSLLDGIEFLTGEDPNPASFLLVVGMVTVVFIALFQFTLPSPVSYLLTAGVLFVTILSAVFGSLLDGLGYFDREPASAAGAADGESAPRPWVPMGRPSAPLPPLINFDAELRAYHELFDGDLPGEFDAFIDDYRRLKTNPRNRSTIASDLRASLNPIGALFEDGTEGDRLYEDVSRRLFRYIGGEEGHITLDDVAFYDDEDARTDVQTLRNRLGRVELGITNEGEAADVTAIVTFYDGAGGAIASRTCSAGVVRPGASKVVAADVFVPGDTARAGTSIRISDPERAVAGA